LNHDETPEIVIGRFAPSPTGPLHFGSLVAAVGSYCLARQRGGRWFVRMEDLDTPRVVPGAADSILRSLENLGLLWDGEIVYQSRRTRAYEEALEMLRGKGLLFDCACSRKEVLASAPHPGEEGPVYAGTCRNGLSHGRIPRALRVRVPEGTICFSDGVFGTLEQCLASAVGDFVLRRADGLFAYQLAVVVDDADAGVNQVVRGADLLSSTPRQIYLYGCLGKAPPRYVHLPLAMTETGEKISKRHGHGKEIYGREDGRVLWDVLNFLGQAPPRDFANTLPREILRWGIRNFAAEKIPRVAELPHFNKRGE